MPFYVDTLGLRPDERSRMEFWVGETCFGIWEPGEDGPHVRPAEQRRTSPCTSTTSPRRAPTWRPRASSSSATRFDTGVCHMAFFNDPDGNDLMLHSRYAPRD